MGSSCPIMFYLGVDEGLNSMLKAANKVDVFKVFQLVKGAILEGLSYSLMIL